MKQKDAAETLTTAEQPAKERNEPSHLSDEARAALARRADAS